MKEIFTLGLYDAIHKTWRTIEISKGEYMTMEKYWQLPLKKAVAIGEHTYPEI